MYFPVLQGIEEISSTNIAVKRMGDLNGGPFLEHMKKKYKGGEAEVRAANLCSLWQFYINDSAWHPFKLVKFDGEMRVCFNSTYHFDDTILKFTRCAACHFFFFYQFWFISYLSSV